ncbi:MAG: RIP metalloprotease RseP [Termitinemataceae bacterium]|nr:MAG: RIP metalloprotease RseP [Termitinemataceae bacterium]
MIILKILLGLVGLGVVVFVHELGHFIAARAAGIDVEAFSLGWGKTILSKKVGTVEYRIALFPVGGYCKMRGDTDFQKAWQDNKDHVKEDRGTFLGAHPAARMLVAFAGPFFNVLFAVIVFSVIWGAGFEYTTMENRIVLASDINPGESYPAERAGLLSGDKIIAINKMKIENYYDIQTAVALNAKKDLQFTVLRDGKEMQFVIKPELEKSTGAGKIGIYFWADPVIENIDDNSAAAAAGLLAGDRILKINGQDFNYTVELLKILGDDKENTAQLNLEVLRAGKTFDTVLQLGEGNEDTLGIAWQAVHYKTPKYSPLGAIAKGSVETWKMFATSVYSLSLLFGGVDLTKAVSGPVRITYMTGDIAAAGFQQSIGKGLRSVGNFLAIISIALAVMNLLPLPILDGGLIVIFFVELLRRRPMNPRFIAAFQTVGIVLIAGLMIVAVFGDILFLFKQ